jgi:hypothetical protein
MTCDGASASIPYSGQCCVMTRRGGSAVRAYFFSIIPSFFVVPSSFFIMLSSFIIAPSDIAHPAAVPITIASTAAVIQRVIVASHP